MDPEHWRLLELHCFAALERPPAERSKYLDAAFGDNAKLRREAESLLEQLDTDPSFMERPIVDRSDPSAPPRDVALPSALGPYRMVRRLGGGGMGEVFLAVQEIEDVRQTVAIKVVRPGRDTGEVLSHFRLERRILAELSHPNIARLIDAGATDDGRPYFVMEYVPGRPVDEHCDTERLSVDDRIRLFLAVCGAVQHAHQKLVVHRDLKPGNILVEAGGIPKLLDFGIGKVLGESQNFGAAVETRTRVRMLTPAYAAPEQVLGDPVTTATDVYALGVLLYQLLAGRHPVMTAGDSSIEVERAVVERDPPPPSAAVDLPIVEPPPGDPGDIDSDPTPADIAARRGTENGPLRRRLEGDLDNIVLMAMRKEPERRYASAAALAEDLERHLAGHPVRARPDTFGYRARKFVGRNAGWVAAAVVAGLGLGTTTTVTLVQSRRVAREAAIANNERDKAVEVRGFLMEMFGATGSDRSVGDSLTARRLLDLQAAALHEAYRDRPELRAEMLGVLADGYDRLGLLDEAEPLAREALSLRRAEGGPEKDDLAASLALLGWITYETGAAAEAEPLLREAVEVGRASRERRPEGLTRALNDLGVVLLETGDLVEAGAAFHEALAIRRAAFGDTHRSVGITASNLGALYFRQARLDDAIQVQELAVSALLQSVGAEHVRSVVALGNLAAMRHTQGDWAGAEREYRQLLERQISLRGQDDPQSARVRLSLATVLQYLASEVGTGATPADERRTSDDMLDEAEHLMGEALTTMEARLGRSHPEVAQILSRLAGLLAGRGMVDEALTLQERAVETFTAVHGVAHAETGSAIATLAELQWRLGGIADALRLQRQAIETLEGTSGPDHPTTAVMRATLCGWLVFWLDRPHQALPACAKAEQDLRDAPAAYQVNLTRLRLALARALFDVGDRQAADAILADLEGVVDAEPADAHVRALFDSLTADLARSRR